MKKHFLLFVFMVSCTCMIAQPPTPTNAPPLPPVLASTLAWADYDADGDPDLFIAGDSAGSRYSALLRNDSTAFVPIATSIPRINEAAAAWEDFDGDLDPDLLVTGRSEQGEVTQLWRNDGGGTFTQISIPAPGLRSGAVEWADLDKDGDKDIFLTGHNFERIYTAFILQNDGGGNFTRKEDSDFVGIAHGSVSIGDVNGDTLPEIVVAGYIVAGDPSFRLRALAFGHFIQTIFGGIDQKAGAS